MTSGRAAATGVGPRGAVPGAEVAASRYGLGPEGGFIGQESTAVGTTARRRREARYRHAFGSNIPAINVTSGRMSLYCSRRRRLPFTSCTTSAAIQPLPIGR